VGSDRGHLEPGGDYDPATGKYQTAVQVEAQAAEQAYQEKCKEDEDTREAAEQKRWNNDEFNGEHGGLPEGDPAYPNGGNGVEPGNDVPPDELLTDTQNEGPATE
jgi:hypothetical protein